MSNYESNRSGFDENQRNEVYDTCPHCNHRVSPNALACPNCGEPLKNNAYGSPKSQGVGFWGIVFAVVVALMIMSEF